MLNESESSALRFAVSLGEKQILRRYVPQNDG